MLRISTINFITGARVPLLDKAPINLDDVYKSIPIVQLIKLLSNRAPFSGYATILQLATLHRGN